LTHIQEAGGYCWQTKLANKNLSSVMQKLSYFVIH